MFTLFPTTPYLGSLEETLVIYQGVFRSLLSVELVTFLFPLWRKAFLGTFFVSFPVHFSRVGPWSGVY